ncbi:MAG: hypothetical protein CW338_02175 [Clostridiales bacterium]|nr:hypothetical protein [Clostridiales bacterium]
MIFFMLIPLILVSLSLQTDLGCLRLPIMYTTPAALSRKSGKGGRGRGNAAKKWARMAEMRGRVRAEIVQGG